MNDLILMIALLFSPFFNQSIQDLNNYPIKSGMIKYQFEGRVIGTEEIYFDDYGSSIYILKTVCHESTGRNVCDSVLKILCSDSMLVLNTSERTAKRYPLKDTLINCINNIVSPEMLESMGYFKEGTEKVSGVLCNRYSGENGTMWVWNNIILKSQMVIMNIQMKMEAVEVYTGIDVPKSKFKLPSNYKLIN
ncbi:MAG: hypothetical protein HQ521_21740 [Bacteroidetes bacterium]|nr:hypothetical protein [Bacteroidota bacterium]